MRPPQEQKQQSSAQQGRAALHTGFPHSETRKIRDPDLLKNVHLTTQNSSPELLK